MDLEYKNIKTRADKINRSDIIAALKEAKEVFRRPFTLREFDKVSKICKHTRVINEFKTWKAALLEIGLDR